MYTGYVFKELMKRGSRTATVVLAIAVLAAMLFLLSGVSDAYSSMVRSPFQSIGSDMIVQKNGNATTGPDQKVRVPFGREVFAEAEAESLSRLDHVTNVSKSLVVWELGRNGFTSIEGIEPDSFVGQKLRLGIVNGTFIAGGAPGQVVVEKHFANFNHISVGNVIALGNSSFGVVGIVNVGESQAFSSNVYMTVPDAQRMAGITGYDRLYVKIDSLSNEGVVRREMQQADDQVIAISGNTISTSLGGLVDIFNGFYAVGAGVVLLLAVLVLVKLNSANLLERRKDIAVLRAVGWTGGEIMKQIMAEVVIQAFAGFILGLLASFVILDLIGTVSVQVAGSGLSTTSITMPVLLSPLMIVEWFVAMLAVCLISVYALTKEITSIKPSENLRNE